MKKVPFIPITVAAILISMFILVLKYFKSKGGLKGLVIGSNEIEAQAAQDKKDKSDFEKLKETMAPNATNFNDHEIRAKHVYNALFPEFAWNLFTGLGTDEKKFFLQFKDAKVGDVKLIYVAFGKKFGRTLFEHCKEELSGADLKRASSIFRQAGIIT